MRYSEVHILIPTYNRCKILEECLASISAQNYPKNLVSITVLDDASSDGTPEFCQRYLQGLKQQNFTKTIFLQNDRNRGIAYGRWYLGQKISPESEMVLFVDDDAYLESGCLKTLVEYMSNNPQVGVVGPRIVYAKNPNETAHNANFVGGWTARYTNKETDQPIICDWVNSTCCLVRNLVLKKTGGFYPGYYICHQEVDFCLRVRKAGYLVVYNPQTIVQHELNLKKPKRERLYYLYRNKILVIRRNFSFIRKIFALAFIVMFGTPKYILGSIIWHKKVVFAEIKIIFLAIIHGFSGREGRFEKICQ